MCPQKKILLKQSTPFQESLIVVPGTGLGAGFDKTQEP